jgi:hypothetical protein
VREAGFNRCVHELPYALMSGAKAILAGNGLRQDARQGKMRCCDDMPAAAVVGFKRRSADDAWIVDTTAVPR